MLNQVVIVGRLIKKPKIDKENDIKVCKITLAVPRYFKNSSGEYDTDYIDCLTYNSVAETLCEYCKKQDLIGIRGRLEKKLNGELTVIAEKVTFLSKGENNE